MRFIKIKINELNEIIENIKKTQITLLDMAKNGIPYRLIENTLKYLKIMKKTSDIELIKIKELYESIELSINKVLEEKQKEYSYLIKNITNYNKMRVFRKNDLKKHIMKQYDVIGTLFETSYTKNFITIYLDYELEKINNEYISVLFDTIDKLTSSIRSQRRNIEATQELALLNTFNAMPLSPKAFSQETQQKLEKNKIKQQQQKEQNQQQREKSKKEQENKERERKEKEEKKRIEEQKRKEEYDKKRIQDEKELNSITQTKLLHTQLDNITRNIVNEERELINIDSVLINHIKSFIQVIQTGKQIKKFLKNDNDLEAYIGQLNNIIILLDLIPKQKNINDSVKLITKINK